MYNCKDAKISPRNWTVFLGFGSAARIRSRCGGSPYLDTNLTPEQRAADLVHRMTLAEKATQMQNNSAAVRGSTFLLTNGGARHCMG